MSSQYMSVVSQLLEAQQLEMLDHMVGMVEQSKEAGKLTAQLATMDIPLLKDQFSRIMEGRDSTGQEKEQLVAVSGDQRGGWWSLEDSRNEWEAVGLEAIRKGEVGVILLAGGQGTRLGSSKPKALYDLGLPSRKTLLQLQAERVLSLKRLASSSSLPWYIMTSPQTHSQLEDALSTHNYYGLNPDDVTLFCQGSLPCLSEQGSLLLSSPSSIAMSPDGNGGLYSALHRSSLLSSMETRGIRHVFVYCVDNVLVKVADPVFLGFCIQREAEVGNKVVQRKLGESVGVTGLLGGHTPSVLEYTECTSPTAEVTDANICIHYFSFDFLSRAVERETELPLHRASKKIPYLDLVTGEMITPSIPNGIKLEKFVFDSFRFCSSPHKFVVFEVLRDEEFAPLKNSSGEGSPAVCREAVNRLHRKWLLRAGARIVVDQHSEEEEDEEKEEGKCSVEVSPLVSYFGEGLESLVSGKILLSPLHVTPNKKYF